MAKRAILAGFVLAALVASPALAVGTDCFTPITAAPSEADAAFHKARIASCTELLGSQLTPETRLQALGSRSQSFFYLHSFLRALLDLHQTEVAVSSSQYTGFNRALIYETLGYSALALPQIDASISSGNDSASALADRAYARMSAGRYAEAIADANLAI